MRQQHIHDTDRVVAVQHQATVFQGAIWDIQRDTFTMTDTDQPLTREYITHPGAVAIVAVDDQQRIAMINQYRHPVGQDCWEIPAGLLDVEGESHLVTAQRELAEEADLQAELICDRPLSFGWVFSEPFVSSWPKASAEPADQHHQREAEEART